MKMFEDNKFLEITNRTGYTRRDIIKKDGKTQSILRCCTCNKFFTYSQMFALPNIKNCPHCGAEFWW